MTSFKFPNVVEADMMMRMKYETAFDIYDHDKDDDPEVPWPLLAISPRESMNLVDPLDFRLDQFAENRVYDIFGIPFDQLIQFPRKDFLKVIASAKKHSGKLLGGSDTRMKELERSLGLIAKAQASNKQH